MNIFVCCVVGRVEVLVLIEVLIRYDRSGGSVALSYSFRFGRGG